MLGGLTSALYITLTFCDFLFYFWQKIKIAGSVVAFMFRRSKKPARRDDRRLLTSPSAAGMDSSSPS